MVLNFTRYSTNLLCFLFQYSLIQVDIYESRSFIGGKVGSFVDKKGNHIEMGLHVFFGCYNNLFRLMKKVNNFYLQSKCMSFFSCILPP
jgi:predicted NAD/FAD-binding protein